jgi:hypothetical protein
LARRARRAASLTGALQDGLVQMVAAALTGGPVEVVPRGWEDPLPGPVTAGVRVLAGQGPGQLDPAGATSHVGLVLPLHALEMVTERALGDGGENGHAILGAFPVTDDDLARGEVDVLDSEAAAFQQAKTGPVQKGGHEPGRAVQLGNDRAYFVAGQDDGEMLWAPGPDNVVAPRQVLMQDVAREEQERAERLVLGGGSHATVDGQGAEEARALRGAHLGRMALAVEEDVAANPTDGRRLGAAAAVAEAIDFADAVEELGRA